jgi:hypothetical protein
LSGGSERPQVASLRDFFAEVDGLSNPAFNAEGKLVYAVRRNEGDIAVLAGSDPGPGFESIFSPIAFTDDSKHFAYVAVRSGTFVEVRDNVPVRTFSAVAAGHNGAVVTEWIGLSDDGAHLAYVIAIASGQEHSKASRSLIIDGRESKLYDDLFGGRFAEDGKSVTFVACDGMRLLRVTSALQ